MESVGLPATFDICQTIVAAGGRIANWAATANRWNEKLWDRNISHYTGGHGNNADAADGRTLGQAAAE